MKLESQIVLSTSALTKSITNDNKELKILSPIDLEVKQGESVAIVGASGSGKTTLLSILAGLDIPSTGEVVLHDHKLHEMNEEQRSAVRAQHVGFIFQSFLLVNSLTALENVMLPAELAGDSKAKDKALKLLDDVGLGERGDHFPNQLSGGEQQRVAIARAFIKQPDILFADEPTGNLDTNTGKTVEELLFKLNEQQGTTLVLVTHDNQLAKKCQRQVVMQAGKIIDDSANLVAEAG